jgi:hypothetical protein
MPFSYIVYGSVGFVAAAICIYFIVRIADKDKRKE